MILEVMDDSLRLELVVPTHAQAGSAVPVELRVRNTSKSAVALYLRGRSPTAEVIVRDEAGQPVWRRLEGATIPAILELRLLDPGALLTLRAGWPAPETVPAGTYRVEAELLTDAAPIRFPPATVRIQR